jgi:hypothetical protein
MTHDSIHVYPSFGRLVFLVGLPGFTMVTMCPKVQRGADLLVNGLPDSAIDLLHTPTWKGGHIITMADKRGIRAEKKISGRTKLS